MAKENEIDYIKTVAQIEDVPVDAFRDYLARKPFSDTRCGEYLMDIAQVMNLLPSPPVKLLDIGVGSGWTSELFAQRGYDVLGLDISPDMIELANKRARPGLSFKVCDYETDQIATGFDAAVIYDSLHHAEKEYSVIQNIFDALVDGGILITVEPGAGHSKTADSIEVMRKYGTTEKDMPFVWQRELMLEAGFGQVDQYVRLSQLPIEEVSNVKGAVGQVRHAVSLGYGAATGSTSVVVAKKCKAGEKALVPSAAISEALQSLSVVHDTHIQKIAALVPARGWRRRLALRRRWR